MAWHGQGLVDPEHDVPWVTFGHRVVSDEHDAFLLLVLSSGLSVSINHRRPFARGLRDMLDYLAPCLLRRLLCLWLVLWFSCETISCTPDS